MLVKILNFLFLHNVHILAMICSVLACEDNDFLSCDKCGILVKIIEN